MSVRPSHFHVGRGQAHGAPRSQKGFTLVELMISLLLGLIVTGAVVSVFGSTQQSTRTNLALGDVQSGSRLAFELMARDIRNAGNTGCYNSSRVANLLKNGSVASTTPDWWANWNNPLLGYDNSLSDPIVTAAGLSRTAKTDSLSLVGTADAGYSLASDTETGTNPQFALNDTSTTLNSGDVVVVCDPDHAAIVQLTSTPTSSPITVNHNVTASGFAPGNCSNGLGFPTDCSSTAGNAYTYLLNASMTPLTAVDWSVAANTVGGNSLYRVSLTNTGGTVTPAAFEMVRNVSGMTLSYLQTGADGSSGTGFVAATKITDWTMVSAVQVTLSLVSSNSQVTTNGHNAAPLKRTFTSTITLRNRVS